ncbi:MAG: FmdB family zinc ribbon protein [Nitrospiria bacterium]
MPIYEYECELCKHQFELIQKFSDLPAKECPLCKGNVRKLISSSGIMFKGKGWYVTDYSDKMKNKRGEEKIKSESNETKTSEKTEPSKSPGTSTTPSLEVSPPKTKSN